MDDQPPGRTKVAVLGGGVGGITAAFELSATPELRRRFDVTVYQLGWRIGGKGASGRNLDRANRIEEHGLHIWFGFYDNAFRLMRDAYAELGPNPRTPLATFDEAFAGCDEIVLYDPQGKGWHAFKFDCPRNTLTPGDAGGLPTFWEMATIAIGWAYGQWRDLRAERGMDIGPAPEALTPAWFDNLAGELGWDPGDLALSGADHLLALAQRLAQTRAHHTDLLRPVQDAHSWLLVTLLSRFRDWLWADVVKDLADGDPDLRLFFTIVDTIASTTAGIVQDRLLEEGFDAVNGEEWCDWLRRHGAHEVTIGSTPEKRSPVLRSVYDVAFGYTGGHIAQANVAAGTATNDLLRLLFSYRGSLMYKMQAGMGDVVFAPLYEVLHARGVKFEFFHAITALRAGPDGLVDSIDYVRQVELAPGHDEYDPHRPDGRLFWGSEPNWNQLADEAKGVNFELELNPLRKPTEQLERGRHFDCVVLGIPVGALGDLCQDLMARNERFRDGVEKGVTVRTQAFQLWTTKTSTDLGWKFKPNSVAGCYVEPLDTYAEMSHLLPQEGDQGARGIAYFCGVLDDVDGEDQDAATARVKANALDFVKNDLGTLWPQAVGPQGFDWDVLVDPQNRKGPDRFDAQYWRANITPWERYVLTPAGSVEHRLPSDDSGFANLVLAGDWTKNGIDGGCVEAAVVSGMQAARKLTGIDGPVTGESPRWPRPGAEELPTFVEFGGRADSPGPFRSLDGKLRGFVLEGDLDLISETIRRTLSEPSGMDYRVLGHHVLLLIGGFQRVSSVTAPFNSWGTVAEIQASFWIPVVSGHDLGDVFLADRFGLALPYIFVNNPMSYLGGRDNYGYPKSMAIFDPEDGVGEHTTMKVFGGNFGRNESAGWHEFMEISPLSPPSALAEVLNGPSELMDALAPDVMSQLKTGELILPDLRCVETLFDDMRAGRIRQLFLKQFRDATDGTRACYRSVVEVPGEIVPTGPFRLSRGEWEVNIQPLDTHPIGAELGITGRMTARTAIDADFNLRVENGLEVGRVGAAAGLPATTAKPNGAHNGIVHTVEQVLGEILHRVPYLDRLPRW